MTAMQTRGEVNAGTVTQPGPGSRCRGGCGRRVYLHDKAGADVFASDGTSLGHLCPVCAEGLIATTARTVRDRVGQVWPW